MDQSIDFQQDLTKAMKAADATRVAVLRLLIASINNARIEKGSDLKKEDQLKVLKKEAKKRQESIVLYKKAERKDLLEKEEAELQIIKEYLPAQMSQDQVRAVVQKLKKSGELGEDFGANMKRVMAELKGQAEGQLVAKVVKQES